MTPQEYNRRCRRLLAKMAPRSAALIFAAPEALRSADSYYPYRQNSDFWYFTGFNEPQALLILFKSNESHNHGILFNQIQDKTREIWTGYRLHKKIAPGFLSTLQVLPWDDIDSQLYLLLNGLNVVYHAYGEYKFADALLFNALDKLRRGGARQQLQAPATLVDWRPWVHEMRLIKSEEEVRVMRRACEITALAHTRAIHQCRPGMYEYQLEGEIQYEFSRHGARFASYNTIIGSGKNSCILHYTENASRMHSGDLVLIDAGCEYQGYASDITRTIPINGRFSPEQRSIYNLVLAMLNCALELCGPGCSIQEVSEKVVYIMVAGLVKLGVMKGEVETLIATQSYQQFFMHGLSHWLGIDVHDVGDYGSSIMSRELKPGMVLAIEPGIYITSNADVPAPYRGIGIRIEDNIVITATGNENLTTLAAKEAQLIETIMATR